MNNNELPKEPTDEESAIFAAELGAQTPEVDLHGLLVDQALYDLDIFINHEFAYPPRVAIKVVKIIHGRGEGKLQKAVTDYLKKSKLIKYFRDSQSPAQAGAVMYAVLFGNK
ncbi:MAG: Smr/MutS family protein [Patescibacteria group bacterium]|jgi:dsDNA-specific endonuclease/ATPase MutS2